MKHKLTRNIGLKLLSLVVAFFIWLLVVNIDDPMDSKLIRDVQIQTVNADSVAEIDKTFELVSDDTVVIKVSERTSVLERLTKDSFTVIADMESINEMSSVPLTVICSNPSITLDEIQVVPSSVKVKLEQKKQSEFVVNIEYTGSEPTGYAVGKAEVVEGKTVQIAGPESIIDRIGKVVATVNLNQVKSDSRVNASLKVYDKNGDALTTQMERIQIKDSNGVLLAENQVSVDIVLWEILNDVPVAVETSGTPAEGYRVTSVSTVPVTMNLVGTQEALAELNGKITLKDSVSVDGATESFTETLDISETLAEIDEMRLVSGEEPTIAVTVQIEKTGDQTLHMPLSNLEVLNRPENMVLTFSPADQIAISVHAEDVKSSIQLDDIKARIDLAVCEEPGDYEIPVEIELPEGYTLVSDVKLVVNATEPEQIEEEDLEDTGE